LDHCTSVEVYSGRLGAARMLALAVPDRTLGRPSRNTITLSGRRFTFLSWEGRESAVALSEGLRVVPDPGFPGHTRLKPESGWTTVEVCDRRAPAEERSVP